MKQAYAEIKVVDPAGVVILGPLAYDFFDDPPQAANSDASATALTMTALTASLLP